MWHRVWIRERKLVTRRSYYVCWYGPDGRRRSTLVGSDKRLANDLRRKKEMELNSGVSGEPRPVSYRLFVREHLELTLGRVAPKALQGQRKALELFAENAEPKRLADIDHQAVEKFIAARCKGVSPATVNKDIRTLKAIFSEAVRRGFLKANPFIGIKKLRGPERAIRVLTLDEIERLLVVAPSARWTTFIYLALTTGMRLGELCHLEWDDVDLTNRTVTVQNKGDWRTKSRKIRHLALTDQATFLLGKLRSKARSSSVFETRDGRPMTNNMDRDFARIVRKARIKRCTIHDLRRTFASHLAMAGVNQAIVQKLAGHASISTTLKYYTHILPEPLRRAQRSLPYARTEGGMLTLSAHGPSEPAKRKKARDVTSTRA